MPTSFWLNATGNCFFRTNILCVGNSKIHQIFNGCIPGNDSVIIILVNDIEDVCQHENLPQKMSSITSATAHIKCKPSEWNYISNFVWGNPNGINKRR